MGGGGGGTPIIFSWGSENLNLFKTMLTFILQPYSSLNTENHYPILDLFSDLLFPETHSLLRKVVILPTIPVFKFLP